ncbi:MAG: helix-turn-helix transcriptional regulator [Prolixibacteraceae bacterium]|jgi:putative transcriptional regulator|nr:helix-turn-helix transcriptional regulator [Prolixibacteraceae bacterium]MBT6006980.1 helix-turn-helix transcriptional regulator [Prolixibacteraceae bacterium]MBT6765895.1 helix-turn-helix transcriptional regulator [Prolixibacteraceae bacterium]MBT7000765.1 helix-turn-helix transcriptional regulator [Prolixibacteraceae bacterium]MBT7394859.1 helix-turn-helix transcriptional regulator [Prolixibacteraceae bacterium]
MKSRKLYNRISVLRKEKGISRQDLADIIGVNFQTIGYLEREEYNPSLDLAFKISEYFGLPIELIFSPKPLKSLIGEIVELKNKIGGK